MKIGQKVKLKDDLFAQIWDIVGETGVIVGFDPLQLDENIVDIRPDYYANNMCLACRDGIHISHLEFIDKP